MLVSGRVLSGGFEIGMGELGTPKERYVTTPSSRGAVLKP